MPSMTAAVVPPADRGLPTAAGPAPYSPFSATPATLLSLP